MASTRPFSPQEARRLVQDLRQPAVFLNMTGDWPVLGWTAENLSGLLGDRPVRFRLGRKQETKRPVFETQCSYIQATLVQFLSWTRGQDGSEVGPFCDFPRSQFWAYADYKYIAMLFEDRPSMFQDVRWADFGFPGRDGKDSTLWIGTLGADTPCHLDSYGCNLVLQVQGRKCWHLFPPDDTPNLYPTRIPYEESSVFSRVDVTRPDLQRFPAFRRARVHRVTLQPGQVLLVPRRWWHHVESMDPVTVSVNSWIELEDEDAERLKEAVTRTVVCALKTTASVDNTDAWLNPTEVGPSSHDENLHLLSLALGACLRGGGAKWRDRLPAKRDGRGRIRRSLRFGPDLLPVSCQEVQEVQGGPAGTSTVHLGPCDCGDTLPEDTHPGDTHSEDTHHVDTHPVVSTVTTNELLECLVHPSVVAQVSRLLLELRRAPGPEPGRSRSRKREELPLPEGPAYRDHGGPTPGEEEDT